MGILRGLKLLWQAAKYVNALPPAVSPGRGAIAGASTTKVPGGGPITDYTITGRSTISLRVFRAALLHHVSPAIVDMENTHVSIDMADELYHIADSWGINPAVALAFFLHESGMGTKGAATSNKNWGNLRRGPAEMSNDGKFARYSSWAVGLDDFCRLMAGPLYVAGGLDTVSKVTPRYAPASDANDPARYAAAVNAFVAIWETMG